MDTKLVFLHFKKVGGLSLISVLGQIYGFDNVLIDNMVSEEDLTSPVRASDHPAFRRSVDNETGRVRSTTGRQRIRAAVQMTSAGQRFVRWYRGRNVVDHRTFEPAESFAVVAGHFHPEKYARLRGRTRWMTMIREPVGRAASHYRFLRTNPGDEPEGYQRL